MGIKLQILKWKRKKCCCFGTRHTCGDVVAEMRAGSTQLSRRRAMLCTDTTDGSLSPALALGCCTAEKLGKNLAHPADLGVQNENTPSTGALCHPPTIFKPLYAWFSLPKSETLKYGLDPSPHYLHLAENAGYQHPYLAGAPGPSSPCTRRAAAVAHSTHQLIEQHPLGFGSILSSTSTSPGPRGEVAD